MIDGGAGYDKVYLGDVGASIDLAASGVEYVKGGEVMITSTAVGSSCRYR